MINQNNPLQPLGAPTADLQLNAYRQRYTMLTQSLNEQTLPKPEPVTNPFAPTADPVDTQDKKRAQIEQWLAPIDRPNPEQSTDYHTKRQAKYDHHIENDPVFKEHGEQIRGVMEDLLGQIQQGSISHAQAMDVFNQYADEHIEPTIDKHHSGSMVGLLSEPVKATPKLMRGKK